ncbi:hypothetical protein EG328_007959 [Venturia inaequalis]|uniref:Uncharacterized protein n=1 Tax=Venturia inaequalis TaxID=5025 RepID=A0A8H3YSI6_VENIN|nr:hypothetical protein EG328_007959 [Venturia inaequalis]
MANNSLPPTVNGHDALQLRPTCCPTCQISSTAPSAQIADVSPQHSQYTITSLYWLENTSLSSVGLFIPLCRFKEWIQTTDCGTFSQIRSLHIQMVCNDTQCEECFLPTRKGAKQVRDFLPLLRFAMTYGECGVDFALPFGGTAAIEPQPLNHDEKMFVRYEGKVPADMVVERFMDVDFSAAGTWYGVFFVWASVREQEEGYAERGELFFSVKAKLGEAMAVWVRRFGDLCGDERVLGFLWNGMAERIMVDVLGGFYGVDGGEGREDTMYGRVEIEVDVIKSWQ